jgi:hypothetical protein
MEERLDLYMDYLLTHVTHIILPKDADNYNGKYLHRPHV